MVQKTIAVSIVTILSIFSLYNCSSFGGKKSQVQFKDNLTITDQAAYKKALRLASLANQAAMRDKMATAIKMAEDSLAIHDNFEAYYIKGTVLYRLNKPDEAMEAYRKAEDIRPYDQQLLMSIAVVELGRGNTRNALERYKKLHENYPDEPVYAFKVGTTYKLLNDYESALTYLKKAEVEGYAQLDQVYIQLGDISLELKEYEDSEKYFARAKELNPGLDVEELGGVNTRVARMLEEGNSAMEDGRFEEAASKFEQASNIAPTSPGPFLLTGAAYLSLMNYEAAVTPLKKAIQLNPENPEGYSLLGSAYYKKEDFVSARKVFETGIEISPESYELYNKLGLLLRDSGELRSAIDSFRKSVKINDAYVPGRVNLGYAYMDDHRYVDARRHFETILDRDSGHEEAKKGIKLLSIYKILDRGDRELRESTPQKARKIYESAYKIDDSFPLTRNAVARTYFAQKKYDRAEKLFLKALEADPDNIPALQGLIRTYSKLGRRSKKNAIVSRLGNLTRKNVLAAITLGRIKEDEGKLDEARKYYLSLMDQYSKNEAVRARLGFVYYKMGVKANNAMDYRNALSYFEKANEYNSGIPMIKETLSTVRENIQFERFVPDIERGETLYARGRYGEALAVYEKVYPQMKKSLILVRIAECYMAMEQEDRGVRLLEQASENDPDDVEIAEAINTYLLKSGDLDRAKKGFERIIQNKENAYYSHYKLGVIQLREGKEEDAIESFTRALIFRPDFKIAHVTRGVAFYAIGKDDMARQEFEEAIRMNDDSPLPHYNMGVMLFNDGILDRAEKTFNQVLDRFPDFNDARYHLSYIYYSRGEFPRAETLMKETIERQPAVRYYSALAQIYEKEYAKRAIPAIALKLQTVYRDILTKFPSTEIADRSRVKLQKLNPDMKILQPYPIEKSADQPPILANGDLIYSDGQKIICLNSTAKKPRWVVDTHSPVRDILVDRAVHVLVPGKVLIYDSLEGLQISEFVVPVEGKRLIGEFNKIGVESSGPVTRLTVFDIEGVARIDREGSRNDRFYYFKGSFYRMSQKPGHKYEMQRLDKTLAGDSVKSEIVTEGAPAGEVKVFLRDDNLFLFFPARKLVVLNAKTMGPVKDIDLKPENRIILPSSATDKTILPESDQLIVYDEDGQIDETVKLPVPAYSLSSVAEKRDGRLIYVGRDRKVRMIDMEGESKWSVNVPSVSVPAGKNIRAAYTLYY